MERQMERRMTATGLKLGLCLGIWGVLGLVGTLLAQQPVDLGEVIDQAIQSAGGAEKLSRLTAQTWRAKMKIHEGAQVRTVDAKYAVQWPDKLRSDVTGSYTMVRNGEEGWLTQGKTLQDLSTDQLLFLKEDMHVNWLRTLAPLRGKGLRYQSVPPIEVDGRETIGVRVSSRQHRDVVFLFDKQTHDVVKTETKSRGLGDEGELANIESYYSEFEEVAGTRVPTRVRIVRDGELFMEIEISDIQRSEKLDPKLFTRPQTK
jgi:outer membrane lipoprotein-sorting protein